MHELSLVTSLFEILEKHAKEQKANRIITVKLQVGLLSGIVPDLLQSAFDMYKKNTIAEHASLNIEPVPLKIQCLKCRHVQTHDDIALTCSRCGSSEIKTLAGTELILERIELETD